MKYEFKEIDEDITELRYKDKSFTAKRNIELVKEVEDINRKAEIDFLKELKKDGLTVNDLVSEVNKNGKIYYDYSNVDYLKNNYIERKKVEFFQNFCKDITGMTLEELVADIGLENDELTQFGYDFSQMISGVRKELFPSKKEK